MKTDIKILFLRFHILTLRIISFTIRGVELTGLRALRGTKVVAGLFC